MAPSAKIKDSTATIPADMSWSFWGAAARLAPFTRLAPAITGNESNSEKRAALNLSYPSWRAIVMVTPLREAPGIRAMT